MKATLLPRSLQGRLVALLLALLLGLGAVSLLGILKGSRLLSEEVHFRLNEDVAAHIAETIRPDADGGISEEALKALFMKVMVINPSLEVYLVDPEGRLLAYDAPAEKILRQRVDLGPVRRFLARGDERTVLGDDPRSLAGRKPISVHPVESDGQSAGYLYIVLGGQDFDSVFAGLRQSYIARYAAFLLAGALAVAAAVGVFGLGRLTRPLRELRRVMAGFRAGVDPEPQAREDGPDEVRALERSFAALSRRIDEQMEALRENDERRREFVASVSHDLRTPASAVQGSLEALIDRRDRLTDEERRQHLEVALRQTRRLAGLVSQLFELARLEAREAGPQMETFSLAELVQDIVGEFQPAAERRGVALRARFPYDLPEVRADIGMIERALGNLIDNALRYTPAGGDVVVGLEPAAGGVQVQVSDAGHGIPAEELPHLFERFFRVPRGDQAEQWVEDRGTGLGLAITRRIVELHDGTIRVESRLQEGTSFSFVLPRAGRSAPEPVAAGALAGRTGK